MCGNSRHRRNPRQDTAHKKRLKAISKSSLLIQLFFCVIDLISQIQELDTADLVSMYDLQKP